MGNIICIQEENARFILNSITTEYKDDRLCFNGVLLSTIINNLSMQAEYNKDITINFEQINTKCNYNSKEFIVARTYILGINKNYFIPILKENSELTVPSNAIIKILEDKYNYFSYFDFNNKESRSKIRASLSKIGNLQYLFCKSTNTDLTLYCKIVGDFYKVLSEKGFLLPTNIYYSKFLLEVLFIILFGDSSVTYEINYHDEMISKLENKLKQENFYPIKYTEKGTLTDDQFRVVNSFLDIYESLNDNSKTEIFNILNDKQV